MRAVINKMSLKFESHSVNEAFARQAVGAFVAQLDPTMEALGDIKTVVSEAVTNAIVHGYADKCGFITVTVRLFEGRALELKVKDAGCGLENVEQARQPMFTTGDDTRSGMGFTIMETFTDKMRVRSTPGKGTLVAMVKVLKDAGICNYSIFYCNDELFGYYECEKGVAYAEKVQAESPVVDRWNDYMKDILELEMDPVTGAQPKLEQVFRLD